MALRSYIYTLIIAFFFVSIFTACDKHLSNGRRPAGLHYDTTTTAIIPFNPEYKYPFDSSFKQAMLTQKELKDVDSLVIACVAWYNNELDNDHKKWQINLKKRHYRKQLIVVKNKNGEKEVWVNCFCSGRDKWKHEMVDVMDGGNCYFNFKINLAIKQFYDLMVNGFA
jgi:hypothetical protein